MISFFFKHCQFPEIVSIASAAAFIGGILPFAKGDNTEVPTDGEPNS